MATLKDMIGHRAGHTWAGVILALIFAFRPLCAWGQTSATLYRDGNNNFGIGTVNPVAQLEVAKSSTAPPLVVSNSGGASGAFLIVTSVGNVGIGSPAPRGLLQAVGSDVRVGTGTFVNTSAADDLYVTGNLETAGTIYGSGLGLSGINNTFGWVDSASNVQLQARTDNIGIGTEFPDGKVEIVKSAAQAPLMVSSVASSNGDYLIVGSEGNVGLGTIGPRGLLQVRGGDVLVGTGTFVNTSAADDLYVTGNLETAGTMYGNGAGLSGIATIGWIDGGTNVQLVTRTDNVGIGTEFPDAQVEVVKSAAQAPLLVSSVASSNGDYLIVGSGGNVGIGTIGPRGLLQVKDGDVLVGTGTFVNTSAADDLYVTGNLETAGTMYGNGAGLTGFTTIGWIDNATNVQLVARTDNVGIGTEFPDAQVEVVKSAAQAPLMVSSVASSNGDYLIVGSGGNVGIGTIGPRGLLQVKDGDVLVGTGTFVNTSAADDLYVTSNLEFDGQIFGNGVNLLFPASNGWQDAGTTVHQATRTDNVGIGTEMPNAKVEIVKQAAVPVLMVSSIPTSNGDYFIVTSSGQVGVGTTAMSSKSLLELGSTTQAFVPPNMTASERDAVSSPAKASVAYVTDTTTGFYTYDGTAWQPVYSGAGTISVKYKTADETRNNNTLANDADLFQAISPNEVWLVEGHLYVLNPTSGVPDFQMAFTVPAGATMDIAFQGVAGGITNFNSGQLTSSGTSSGAIPLGNGVDSPYFIQGVIINGANAGTIQFQWAQNSTRNADPTYVKALSFLRFTKVK